MRKWNFKDQVLCWHCEVKDIVVKSGDTIETFQTPIGYCWLRLFILDLCCLWPYVVTHHPVPSEKQTCVWQPGKEVISRWESMSLDHITHDGCETRSRQGHVSVLGSWIFLIRVSLSGDDYLNNGFCQKYWSLTWRMFQKHLQILKSNRFWFLNFVWNLILKCMNDIFGYNLKFYTIYLAHTLNEIMPMLRI